MLTQFGAFLMGVVVVLAVFLIGLVLFSVFTGGGEK